MSAVAGSNIFAPSSTNSATANLNGLFKDTYESKLKDLIPDGVKLLNMIKFMEKSKQPGNNFHSPVVIGMEHGMTWAASDDDAFSLNAPVSGQIKDATIKGSPKVLRSYLGYVAASRAAQGGAQAFMDATKHIVANMLRSVSKKLEIEMLYGGKGYGTVAANTVASTTVVVTTAEWAPGIWAGAEKMPIQIYDVTGVTLRGSYVIQSVDMEARSLVLDAAATLTAGDVIWHKGAKGLEFQGIHDILTTTGTLFGISAGSSALFKGNSYDAGGSALSFPKLSLAASRAVEKGMDGKLSVFVNPRTWSNLLSDQASLRKYDSSYSESKLVNGGKAIQFFSQNGELEIIPSIYIKEGYAFMLQVDEFYRVGSQDLSFKRPGLGDEFISNVTDAAALEMRLYTDQSVFTAAPGKHVVLYNIVNQQ